MNQPLVSVIVVNFNGKQHLAPCFKSLLHQTYPSERIEIILVDNSSSDGSLDLVAAEFPQVKVLSNSSNLGFAPAVNQGVEAASGQYIALINNDAYAAPTWIETLVSYIERERERGVMCVGSTLLDWHGQRIDFIAGGINFYGHGDQFFYSLPVENVHMPNEPVLFVCGGAMLVDRQAFLKVGGFDADYFAYFEDIDLGWRLWLAGYEVHQVPGAVVYHRHHGTSRAFRQHQMRKLYERNALATVIKNYGDDALMRTLPAALMLLLKKSMLSANGQINWDEFDLRYRGDEQSDSVAMPRSMLAYLAAARDLIDNFDAWWRKRQQVQALRQRPDSEILPLFRRPHGPSFLSDEYMLLQQLLSDAFNVRDLFSQGKITRVLIISSDPLTERLAGPGIRALEMARNLSKTCHVILAAEDVAEIEVPDVSVVAFAGDDIDTIRKLANDADVLIVQGFALLRFPALKEMHRIIVVDLYDPIQFENIDLHLRHHSVEQADLMLRNDIAVIDEQIRLGDYFICASERQRDLWLGWLSAAGRTSPYIYRDDPSLRALIDVVPFGISTAEPQATKRVLKGVVPGIEADDTVLLWNGGIWEWFDPLSVIRAMAAIRAQRPQVKLFFMGARHPNPLVPEMRMYNHALELATELGLLNETVFFNANWVPYEERQNYLLEADFAVSGHIEHIETRFSFRTRLLDCIWTDLPMIVNSGDVLSEVVQQHELGWVVAPGDVDGWTAALLEATANGQGREQKRANFAQVREQFLWPNALRPLIEFCQRPRYAADRQARVQRERNQPTPPQPSDPNLVHLLNDLQARNDWLDDVVEAKNTYIAHLERQIQALERGRVMRSINGARRILGRKGE